jgi:hypothetical protein
MNFFRQADRTPAPILRCAARLLPMLALPALVVAPAAGQIFKCTDGSGNVTYQNEPCPKNMKAGRVDIFDNSWTTDRVEKEAEWRRNAAEHRVATGMPVRWVREALGEPAEVRDTATAGAVEVWLYNFPERSVQVGMLNNQVLWFREAPVPAAAARVAPAPDRPVPERAQPEPQVTRAAPAPNRPSPELPVTRMAPPASELAPRDASPTQAEASRAMPDAGRAASTDPKAASPARAVSRGQDCRQAIADLGPPDRQREVAAIDAASDPITEYFYEPSGTAGATRMRVVCANGKVEGVDRTVIR